MTAREKFAIGQRIRANHNPYQHMRGTKEGAVHDFHRTKPELVRIIRDDTRTIEVWHMDFWEPITDVMTHGPAV